MNTAHLRELVARCDPERPLEPGDDLNLDIDRASQTPARGERWVDRLGRVVELSSAPQTLFFTGLPGSGKSTELKRLLARLADPERSNLLPVYIDAAEVLDLSGTLDVADIIAIIVHETERAVIAAEGGDPDRPRAPGYLRRLWARVTGSEIALKEAGVNLSAEAATPDLPGLPTAKAQASTNLILELKTRPGFRDQVRAVIDRQFQSFHSDATAELVQLRARAANAGRVGVIVVFDSLEKINSSWNWQEVMASAMRVFDSQAAWLQLPVHSIYTVPPSLFSIRQGAVEFMPMLKIKNRDGTHFEPSMHAARHLISLRIPDADLAEILGPNRESRVRQLIDVSAGYLRDLIRMLRDLLYSTSFPVSDAEFNRVINRLKDGYRRVVSEADFGWLAQVYVEQTCTIQDESHRQIADKQLRNSVVLRYLNDTEWYSLHPAVLDIPGLERAIRARKAALAQAAPAADGA